MPDAAQNTLGLFDSTALGWTVDTPRAAPEAPAATSGEPDAESVRHGAVPPVRGSNFHLEADRALARGWPARARDNIAAISSVEDAGADGPRTDRRTSRRSCCASSASALRSWRRTASAVPGEDRFPAGLAGDRRDARSRRHAGGIRRAATRHAVCPLHAGDDHPWPLARRRATGLYCGGRVLEPGMGTGLFFALLPAELREAYQLTGIEYDPITARIARLVHPEARVRCEDYARSQLTGALRPRDRQPAVLRSRGAGRSRHARPRAAAARLLHRPFDRAAAPGRDRAVRHQHRHDGQGQHRRRGNTSPAWPTWWAPCVCPKAACARARAPTS